MFYSEIIDRPYFTLSRKNSTEIFTETNKVQEIC